MKPIDAMLRAMTEESLTPPNFGNAAIDLDNDLSIDERIALVCDEYNRLVELSAEKFGRQNYKHTLVRECLDDRALKLIKWILR